VLVASFRTPPQNARCSKRWRSKGALSGRRPSRLGSTALIALAPHQLALSQGPAENITPQFR
jgi:hypothetical protein